MEGRDHRTGRDELPGEGGSMTTSHRKCLVIMPFGKKSNENLSSRLVYDYIILPALVKANSEGHRIDSDSLSNKPVSGAIEKELQDCPMVLADLSENNPNVLFELGFRWAHRKPFVCVSSDPHSAAFWPRVFQIHDYTRADAVDKIAKAVTDAFNDFGGGPTAQDELGRLADSLHGMENPFQEKAACWRIRRLREQLESIRQGTWNIAAKSPTAFVAFMFEEIMEMLSSGDEYFTVTNLNFWSDKAVGESAFLSANVEAARRGVVIKRGFLIDRKQWNQKLFGGDLKKVLQPQLKV